MSLIDRSRAIKSLQRMSKQKIVRVEGVMGKRYNEQIDQRHINYLLRAEERFAHAYAQYVSLRSGDERLRVQIHQRRRRINSKIYYAAHWDEDDFAPLASAFDELLRELQWIQ